MNIPDWKEIYASKIVTAKEAISYIKNNTEITIETDNVILAIGHSARDVFYLLKNRNVTMQAKNFSIGVRIEHKQSDLDRSM